MKTREVGLGNSAEAEILDFEVFVDSVLRAFAAESGFLHSAERRNFRGNQSGVDADHSVFECFGPRHTRAMSRP